MKGKTLFSEKKYIKMLPAEMFPSILSVNINRTTDCF